MNKETPKEYLRFNTIERIQHVILFTTFLLLSFTGWALKYPEQTVEHSSWLVKIWGGAKNAGIVHRIAGITMLLNFAWHVLYLAYMLSTGKMKLRKDTTIIPLPKDVMDAVKNILYFLGLGKEKPQFGRFSYIHKFDYWAVFWGMGIIGLSGFFLAFPVQSSYFFPSWSVNWIWEVISIMHSDEALLAIVFILFWHFYNEHLKWNKFPMSMTWITGKISIEDMKREHPLEYKLEFGDKGDNK
ncbi:formate dehydrogenase subunit gamma [Dissulfurispira sp.]|uniref:formate dehydrogenase subunit gamma n=1 Tax=Dissulfurispira sp. TaxID=2817609 RepID=UPI002FD98B1D